MLPAWATVVIAIVGSVIGAVAGTVGGWFALQGTRLTIAHEEGEAWRTRLITAAEDFALTSIKVSEQLIRDPPDVPYEALGQDALFRLTSKRVRVALLYGMDSEVYAAAREVGVTAENLLRLRWHSIEIDRPDSLGRSPEEIQASKEAADDEYEKLTADSERFLEATHRCIDLDQA